MGALAKAIRAALALATEATPLLDEQLDIPSSRFTHAKNDAQGKKFPQAIAHRGYKDAFPENTMGAFKGAVEVGAHAIETDVHLSKDGVVVLSHDANLKRCFGYEDEIIDCDWSYLETLQTLKEPRQPMPRLKDLLEYLATPGLEDTWVLLDIKMDNNAEDIVRFIAQAIADVKPTRPWNQRILLGCWAGKYFPLCAKYLPGFPITHISFSLLYAQHFFKVPNISFNMLQYAMRGPAGHKFQRDCQAQHRSVFLWTVNEAHWMHSSIKRGVDGVITDDPKKYLEVCKDYDENASLDHRFTVQDARTWLFVNSFFLVFAVLFWLRRGFTFIARPNAVATKKPLATKLL